MARTVFVILIAALLCAGCPSGRTSSKKPSENNISKKQQKAAAQRRVFESVVGPVPESGSLRNVMRRGKLRVALPPEEKPFQYRHRELNNQPMGFNVALAAQMAEVLDVEPDIRILSPKSIGRMNTTGAGPDYDIVFRTPGMTRCSASRSLKYFYVESSKHWLSMCVAGDDDSLYHAVENILFYFKESGIFTYVYSEYFQIL